MNYHQQDRKLHRPTQRRGFGITQTSFAVFIVLILLGIGYFFGNSIANEFYLLRSMLVESNGPVVNLAAEDALITALQSENNQLKELLGRNVSNDKMTLAAVLIRPPQTPYDSIIIDAGSLMGLQVGDIIYAEMNYAIGRVVEVSDKSATIILFSSSNQKANVLIASTTTAVLAEGRGGGNFYIKLPKNIDVAVGDPIIWPDIQTMILGAVDVIDSDDGDAYAHIYFKSPININSLRYVQFKTYTR